MGATKSASIDTTRHSETPISLFLMINTFETGGSERQFAALAQNVSAADFQLHLGCVRNRGALAGEFQDVPEFPLGGSLF